MLILLIIFIRKYVPFLPNELLAHSCSTVRYSQVWEKLGIDLPLNVLQPSLPGLEALLNAIAHTRQTHVFGTCLFLYLSLFLDSSFLDRIRIHMMLRLHSWTIEQLIKPVKSFHTLLNSI